MLNRGNNCFDHEVGSLETGRLADFPIAVSSTTFLNIMSSNNRRRLCRILPSKSKAYPLRGPAFLCLVAGAGLLALAATRLSYVGRLRRSRRGSPLGRSSPLRGALRASKTLARFVDLLRRTQPCLNSKNKKRPRTVLKIPLPAS